MTDDEIKELINRRRQQVLVHSVLYYRMNTNLIADSQWSEWALELEELQNRYPELAEQVPRAEMFRGFDHSTGSTLPLEDEWAIDKAFYLIKCSNNTFLERSLINNGWRKDKRSIFQPVL